MLAIVAASFLGGALTTYVLQRFFQTSSACDLSLSLRISRRSAASKAVCPVATVPPAVVPVAAPASAPTPAAPAAEPAAAAAPTPVSETPAPASSPPAAAPDALPIRVKVQEGEVLAKIIDQYYPGEYRKGLAAIVLANPELEGGKAVRPGQTLLLPRIDSRSRSVKLNDGLYYTLYGSYYSAASWHGDKPWLEKSGVHFLVRVSRDAAGKTLTRVFLGGYARLEDLRAAQQLMHARSRHGRLPWGEVLVISAPPARKDGPVKPKAPAPATAPPAAPSSQTSAPPPPSPTAAKQPPVAAPRLSRPAPPPQAILNPAAAARPEASSPRGATREDTPRLSARLSAWGEALGQRLASLGQYFRSPETAPGQESAASPETAFSAFFTFDAVSASATQPAIPGAPVPAPSVTLAAPLSSPASLPAATELSVAQTPPVTAPAVPSGTSESRPSPPPGAAPTPLAALLNRQATAHKGESLTQIAIRNYGSRDKAILTALILANEEIDTENMIHPGQVINLPRVDLPEEIVQLPDGRYYALYGSYHAAASWEGDKPWLLKNGVRFLVRVTRDAAGGKVQRVFLGGYDKVADLQAARQLVQIKATRAGRPPEVATSRAANPAPAAPPAQLAAAESPSPGENPEAPAALPAAPPRESRPGGLSLGPPWLNSLSFASPAADLDTAPASRAGEAVPKTPPPAQETAAPQVVEAPLPAAASPAAESKSAPGPVAEPQAVQAPAEPAAAPAGSPLLAALPEASQMPAATAKPPVPADRPAPEPPAAPPGQLAAAEASDPGVSPEAPPAPPVSPSRESRPGGLSLGPPWLNALSFASPAADLDTAPASRAGEAVPKTLPPAQETAAPQVVEAPLPAAARPAAESKSSPRPVAGPQAAQANAAPKAVSAETFLLAALPEASQMPAATAKPPVPADRPAPEPPAATPAQLAAAEASDPGVSPEAPPAPPVSPPRESRPGGLSLGPPWLTALGFASSATEPDAAPSRGAGAATPETAPPPRETSALQVAVAPTPAASPAAASPAAPAGKVSWPQENEASLPEAMLPEAAPGWPVLKFPAGLTDPFKGFWHSRLTLPGGWWPWLKSLWQTLVPGGSLTTLEPQAQGEGGQSPGGKTPVLAAADEVAPASEDQAPTSPEALAQAPTSPTNIRRYLDAGGVFHIENRNPAGGNGELYVEPRPATLEAFLKANNEVPLPAVDNAPAGQPFREVSWPGVPPTPLPAPDSKALEKVLPPEGTIRRYRDPLGVLHVVNGEIHNPGNPGEALLARLEADTQVAAAGTEGAPEPAGQAAKGGWPITRVALPHEKNAPAQPPASPSPEKALAPEDLIRRYRDVKGVLHIVNTEPKEPASPSATLLAGAGPAEASGQPQAPRAEDRPTVVWPIQTASLTAKERRLPAPPEPAPSESPWVNEGAIRRYRDAKGILHIKTTEYPKPPLPPNWPAVGRLAGTLPFPLPGLAPRSAPGAPAALPQNPRVPEVVAFRDQTGKLRIRSFSPQDRARQTALELNRAGLEPIIVEAALTYHLPAPLIQAVIKMESNFVPWAVSPKGAMGLMQLMPGTADFLGVSEPFNPRENIMGGCRYLRMLLDSFNDNLALALAAYNAGYQRVIDAGYRVPEIKETQDFVTGVLSRYYTLVLASRPAKI